MLGIPIMGSPFSNNIIQTSLVCGMLAYLIVVIVLFSFSKTCVLCFEVLAITHSSLLCSLRLRLKVDIDMYNMQLVCNFASSVLHIRPLAFIGRSITTV